MAAASTSTPPPPPPVPKFSGNPSSDLITVAQYFAQVYANNLAQYQYIKQVAGFDPASFDPSTLTDPASATVGTAQKTANDAYTLASGADQKADGAKTAADAAKTAADAAVATAGVYGTIVASGASTTATHSFATAQVDTNYAVVLSVKSTTGSPGINATLIIGQSYAADHFTITVNAAPGAGNSVTFNWHLRRG